MKKGRSPGTLRRSWLLLQRSQTRPARAGGGQASAPGRLRELEHRVLELEGQRVEFEALRARLELRNAELGAARAELAARSQAEETLRDSLRHKDDFLASLSHELRNPLAPIRSSLFVLGRVEPGGEQAVAALAVIDRQVTHLTRIVDDLLDLTRIERGKIRLMRQRIELGQIVRNTLSDHRTLFVSCGIELSIRLGSERLWVDADATRIAQVLGNLLGNAAKFTPRGGRVEVALRRETERVLLAVRDNGIGIAPEIQSRIFEPFRQAPQSIDRARGGLGLGLAMVRGLMELQGGTVEVASEGLGRGSEFRLRLPLAAPPLSTESPGLLASSIPRRVLVIEDSVEAADSLREALGTEGHDVEVAYDGITGLALAGSFAPEIVICDLGLPGMNGYEVAQALRADELLRDVYLIALSGYTLPHEMKQAIAAGFDQHLAKPPSLDQLVELFACAPVSRARSKD